MKKNTLLICTVCIALGFSAGWLARPASDTPETARTDTPRPTSRTQSSAGSAGKSRGEGARSTTRSDAAHTHQHQAQESGMTAEMEKQIEKGERMHRRMVQKGIKDRFDMRIAVMIRELDLNADQEAALKAYFDKQLEKLTKMDGPLFTGSEEEVKKLAAALRGDGLNAAMKDHLTTAQMDGLEALQKRKKTSRLESQAFKGLAKLQQTLDLTAEQKDKVYNLLIEDAEKKINAQSDRDFLMQNMMQGMGMSMGFGGMDEITSYAYDGNDGPMDHSTRLQRMKEARKKKIDAKVERLAPVLNDLQKKQYRRTLENKGGMFQMMMHGMGDGGN